MVVARASAAFGSCEITETELEERLVGLHGQTVGSAMTARVFDSLEISADVGAMGPKGLPR